MALQVSGAISFSNINTELGNSSSATLSIGGTAARTLAGKASGAISLSDFYGKSSTSTYTYNNGQPWVKQYSFNTSQTGILGSWTTSSTGLSLAVKGFALVATNSRIYILGGSTTVSETAVTPTAVVQTASIDSSGVIGTWSTATSLPVALAYGKAVTTKNRVYLIGNCSSSGAITTVYWAPINTDGTLGTWTTGSSLATAVCDGQVVITKNRVYLLGGTTTASYMGTVATVQTATIDNDGVIGTWSIGDPLPATRCRSGVAVTNGYVYLIGGDSQDNPVDTVMQAPIASDGTIGAWSTLSNTLADVTWLHQTVVVRSKIFVFGAVFLKVYYATIASDGSIGAWSTGTRLPGYQTAGAAVATSSRLYLLGGYTGSNVYPRVSYTAFAGGLNNYLTSSYSQP